MKVIPRCIIVTGRQGSGKSTLAKKLGERMRMPVVSRDDIKEGYVNTFGVRHDELPPETNQLVTDLFFKLVSDYLTNKVSTVIEAAFQHRVWEPRLPAILELADTRMVICVINDELAFNRPIERGMADPEREFYHGDNRVVHYRKTGQILTPAPYERPTFDVQTIEVSTAGEYVPSIEELVSFLRS